MFDCFNNLVGGKTKLVTALRKIDRYQLILTAMNIIRGVAIEEWEVFSNVFDYKRGGGVNHNYISINISNFKQNIILLGFRGIYVDWKIKKKSV